MAWIESHQELARHPKVERLARALSVSVPAAIGHLHLLWWWAMDYAPSGDIADFDDEELSVATMWPGEGSHLLTALDKCRWTDIGSDGRRRIHDWPEYAGRLLAKREADKERMRNWRNSQTQKPVTRNERITNANVRVTNDVHTQPTVPTNHTATRAQTRAILHTDETTEIDATFEIEGAIKAALEAGYSRSEADDVIADVQRRGMQVAKWRPYLLKSLKCRRADIEGSRAPVVPPFVPNRLTD